MTLRQQQVAVFLATVMVIFGLFAAGVWLIAQRLTTEATFADRAGDSAPG
jgi:hypothetical protein